MKNENGIIYDRYMQDGVVAHVFGSPHGNAGHDDAHLNQPRGVWPSSVFHHLDDGVGDNVDVTMMMMMMVVVVMIMMIDNR